jgi:hypothetical protein
VTEASDLETYAARTARTAELVDQLLAIVAELELMHPGRRFPLDGHLVGSIGEAAAEAMFAIRLEPPSTTGHDALANDGRAVEIKATYGSRAVGLRFTSHGAAAALIVIRLSRESGQQHEVVYNGSLARVIDAAGALQSNGQAQLGLVRLRQIDSTVPEGERVPLRAHFHEPIDNPAWTGRSGSIR